MGYADRLYLDRIHILFRESTELLNLLKSLVIVRIAAVCQNKIPANSFALFSVYKLAPGCPRNERF
jgi:hypothetical protein